MTKQIALTEILYLINENNDFDMLDPLLSKDIELLIDECQEFNALALINEEKNQTLMIDLSKFANITDFTADLFSNIPDIESMSILPKVGDILVKENNQFVSTIPNGTHVLVKEVYDNGFIFFSSDFSREFSSFDSGFRVVGNISDVLNNHQF